MSRLVLDRLCQQILLRGVRATDTLQLNASVYPESRRHKATDVTAPLRGADDWVRHDVTGVKATSLSGTTSLSRPTSSGCPVHGAESPLSTHFSVASMPVEDVTKPGHAPMSRSRNTDDDSSEPKSATFSVNPDMRAALETARPFSEMPAPFSLPIIGTLWMHFPGGPLHGMLFEKKIKTLEELYGPIIREDMMLGFTLVHIFKPEDMEAVYRAQGSRPRRDAFVMLKKYNQEFSNGVQGLITSQGEEWYRLRSRAQVKMLKPKSASAYLGHHNLVARDFVTLIDRNRDENGVIEDLLPELYKFAMEGIGCVCFNRRLGVLAENIPADSDSFRFIRAVNDVMEATNSEFMSIFISKHSANFKKLVKAQSFIKHLSTQEAKRSLEVFSQSDHNTLDGESGDLIPYLMSKTDLTEAEVMALVSEFFFGGVDTTSHFLGSALYCLSKNPEAQEKLVEEINKLVDGNDVITANILGRMSYLKAVAKETFRLVPVAPGNGRTLNSDVVVSGYHVPPGIMVAIHHDWAGKSSRYVKDPDVFMPERWLRGNDSAHADIHPFILMPFGFGPRSCIGRRFAEQEFSLALIKILQKYHVEYAHDKDLMYDMRILNKPLTPLKFRFVPRK